jgi:hypothetical protein
MKRSVSRFIGAPLVAVLLLAVAGTVIAKEKKAAGTKQDRVEGRVQMINKDTSTITVTAKNNVQRQVVYSSDTKFTYRNKPGSIDDVKDGRRVICLGKFEGVKLMASRVDVREGK